MNSTKNTIVERIQQLYTGMQLSASKFSLRIGINQGTFSRYINGQNSPSLELIIRILEAFPSVSADWLLRGVGTPINEERNAAPSITEEDTSDYATLLRTIITLQKVIDEKNAIIESLNAK